MTVLNEISSEVERERQELSAAVDAYYSARRAGDVDRARGIRQAAQITAAEFDQHDAAIREMERLTAADAVATKKDQELGQAARTNAANAMTSLRGKLHAMIDSIRDLPGMCRAADALYVAVDGGPSFQVAIDAQINIAHQNNCYITQTIAEARDRTQAIEQLRKQHPRILG